MKRTETKAKGEEITKSGGVGAGKNVNFILRNFLTKIIEKFLSIRIDIFPAHRARGRTETKAKGEEDRDEGER